MPDQWKSITGLVELEQHASPEPPESSTAKYASPLVNSNTAFARGFWFLAGLLYGIGASILGLVITFFFDLFTGFGLICYLAPAVGWLVGKAIRKGSQGAGGLRYQIAAIILTYSATALPTIPITSFSRNRNMRNRRIHTRGWPPAGKNYMQNALFWEFRRRFFPCNVGSST